MKIDKFYVELFCVKLFCIYFNRIQADEFELIKNIFRIQLIRFRIFL